MQACMDNQVFVIAALMVLALLFLMMMFARLYRKAGPHEALIVYGFRGTRVVKGRGTVIFPMVESCRGLSLELMSLRRGAAAGPLHPAGRRGDRGSRGADQGEVATRNRSRPPPSSSSPRPPQEREGLIRLVMEGHLRGIIGQLTVEEIVKQPEMVGDRMRSTCADDMNKMGLEVISFTIKEVRDKNEYITNMGRPDVARIKRDADVATAEAERDTAIKRAEAAARIRRRQGPGRPGARAGGDALAGQAGRGAARPGSQEGRVPGDRQEAAGAGRQGLRDPDQHHAAAGASPSR